MFHEFRSKSLNLLVEGCRHKVDFNLVTPIVALDFRLFVLCDALLLDQLEALVHLALETKVQHAVSLVKYKVAKMTQIDA